jgi:hypothetical protein
MPDGPGVEDECAALYDTAGVKDTRFLDGTNVFQHGIQLSIRSLTYAAGWAKADAICELLAQVHNEEVATDSDTTFLIDNVSQVGPVFSLGTEQGTKRRQLFTANFLVRIRR